MNAVFQSSSRLYPLIHVQNRPTSFNSFTYEGRSLSKVTIVETTTSFCDSRFSKISSSTRGASVLDVWDRPMRSSQMSDHFSHYAKFSDKLPSSYAIAKRHYQFPINFNAETCFARKNLITPRTSSPDQSNVVAIARQLIPWKASDSCAICCTITPLQALSTTEE